MTKEERISLACNIINKNESVDKSTILNYKFTHSKSHGLPVCTLRLGDSWVVTHSGTGCDLLGGCLGDIIAEVGRKQLKAIAIKNGTYGYGSVNGVYGLSYYNDKVEINGRAGVSVVVNIASLIGYTIDINNFTSNGRSIKDGGVIRIKKQG